MPDNPYASPLASHGSDGEAHVQFAWKWLPLVLVIATLGGAALGTATNCVNGLVSPQFFTDQHLIWENPDNIWASAVVQGAFEGSADGLLYGVVFLGLLIGLARRRCTPTTAIKYAFAAMALALAMWVIGGGCGVTYAALFPENCPPEYFGWHFSQGSLARYAWVRGSYWGIVYGGLLAVVVVSLYLASRLRRSIHRV